MMLTGVTLVGILALTSVIIETRLAKRHAQVRPYTSTFADLFSSSLGAYVAGFAALNAGIAFPLDSYWHALYGIDVAIWAPFHIMIISGMAIMCLGGAYMLRSGTLLAKVNTQRTSGIIRLGQITTIVALAAMLGTFTLMLSDALNRGNIVFIMPGMGITAFPLLTGILTAFTFTMTKYAFPRKASATYVMLAYIAFGLVFSVFVPPATSTLVTSEGLSYLRSLGHFAYLSAVAVDMWWLMPIIVAPLIDYTASLARRKSWTRKRLYTVFTLLFLLTCIPVIVLNPTAIITEIARTGIIGTLLSLAIAVPAILLGIYLGRISGKEMNRIAF